MHYFPQSASGTWIVGTLQVVIIVRLISSNWHVCANLMLLDCHVRYYVAGACAAEGCWRFDTYFGSINTSYELSHWVWAFLSAWDRTVMVIPVVYVPTAWEIPLLVFARYIRLLVCTDWQRVHTSSGLEVQAGMQRAVPVHRSYLAGIRLCMCSTIADGISVAEAWHSLTGSRDLLWSPKQYIGVPYTASTSNYACMHAVLRGQAACMQFPWHDARYCFGCVRCKI